MNVYLLYKMNCGNQSMGKFVVRLHYWRQLSGSIALEVLLLTRNEPKNDSGFSSYCRLCNFHQIEMAKNQKRFVEKA